MNNPPCLWLSRHIILVQHIIIYYQHIIIAYIKTDDIYKDIAEDVEFIFDNSNYKLGRPVLQGKNKKVIG